jgi:hypothetical protein
MMAAPRPRIRDDEDYAEAVSELYDLALGQARELHERHHQLGSQIAMTYCVECFESRSTLNALADRLGLHDAILAGAR